MNYALEVTQNYKKGNFVSDENFRKFIKLSYTNFQKRKFLVISFPKKEILFQTKNFKNWIIQDSIKENFRLQYFLKKGTSKVGASHVTSPKNIFFLNKLFTIYITS